MIISLVRPGELLRMGNGRATKDPGKEDEGISEAVGKLLLHHPC